MAADRDKWKYTMEYLYRYANQVVLAIKKRIRADKLIDTGDLLDSIDYEIITKNNTFQIEFLIGDGKFVYGSGKPSEYGVYQDQGTKYIDPTYFFSAPIPGLTAKDFKRNLTAAMSRDIERQQDIEIKSLNKLLKAASKKKK